MKMNIGINTTDFEKGFTLIEIMIALAITSVVMAGIFLSYSGQQRSELSQTQLVEMQQSIRSSIYQISLELRMAGYDPNKAFGAGIINAGDGSNGSPLTFTYVEGDSVTNPGTLSTVSFEMYDAHLDGDNDIGRQKNGLKQAIAENIQTLNFTYLDSDGTVLAAPIDISAIQAVRIDITAGLDAGDIDYTTPGAVRSVSTTITCRNLGM